MGGARFEFDNFFDFNAEVITQDGFSYLRNGSGVRLNGNDALVGQFNAYSRGVAGDAKLRIRYGSSISGGQLQISIADEIQTTIDIETLPQVDGQDVSFTESPSIDITLPDEPFGFNITIRYLGSSSVIIDEITVSNADDISKAQAHLVANNLNQTEVNNLVTYVNSLDQVSAPNDDDINIFNNTDEPVATNSAKTCFPVRAKATQEIVIICF